jgi:serine protease SohB
VKASRGARLTGPESDLFSGEFWTGRKAVTMGVADSIGDLRTMLRQRFGDDVRLPLVGPERSLLGRTRPGVALKARLFGDRGLADDVISALEERALWSRYGL